jgi:autotransporter-associated beta strand protein
MKTSFAKSILRNSAMALCAAVLGLILAPPVRATDYTWTQNSAATQTWTTAGNWASSTPFVSGSGNGLIFFANTTTALANGTNSITGSVPSTLSMNVLTLNGLGAGATGATNITIATNASTWTIGDGTTSTVNLNGLAGTQGLNYTVAPHLTLNQTTTTFTGNGTANFRFTGNITEAAAGYGITKTGTSILTLSGTNTYTGGTAVNAGAVSFLNTNARPASGTVTVASGATLGLGVSGANAFTSANVDSLFAGTLSGVTNHATSNVGIDTTNGNFTYSTSVASTTRGLTKLGSNTLTLTGNNSFANLTLRGTGRTDLQHSNAAGTGSIFLNGTGGVSGVETVGISGGITVTNAIVMDSTTGRQNITSTGTGNNSLTGGITINGAASNSLVLSNGQTSGDLTVSGGISGASYNGFVSLRGNAGTTSFLNGVVNLPNATPSGSLDVNGSGTWTLNTAGSSYRALSFGNPAGTLVLAVNDAIATNALLNPGATSAATLNLNGFNQSLAGLAGGNATFSITNNGGSNSTLTLAGLTANQTFAGVIKDGTTNKTSLVMNSSSRTQTLNGNNTFSGTTTVTAGTLALGSNLALQNSALDTTGAGTVTFSGTTPTIGGLSGAVNLATKFTTGYSSVTALTLNPQTGVTANYSGNITNGAANMTLTKTGAGTQILSGANTYTGNTTVSTGTLLINGSTSASSAVSVASGATLGGNGTIGGATTITGILAPGNSIGTLNVTSNVTWVGAASAGATTNWLFELGTSNTSDKLNITGDFLKDTSLGTTFMFDFAGSANQGTFTLVDWTGTTGFSVGDFSYTNLGGGLTGTFAFNGTQLDFIAVPEPSTALSMVCGLAIAGFLMHRRRRQLD